MRLTCSLFLIIGMMFNLSAQDLTIKTPKASQTGYKYENFSLPPGIMVKTMNKEKIELKVDRFSLIHVWSINGGGGKDQWLPFSDLVNNFQPKGLQVISVNFENGIGGKAQLNKLTRFFEKNKKPENFYYDSMGYITDFLTVSGFPTYFLVEADGTVVFRTNGFDPNGMAILEQEIKARLKPEGEGGD